MQQRPSHSHQNSIDDNPWLAGFFIAVFVFLGFFVLSLRYHISTLQWMEGGVYIVLLIASIWLLFAWRSLDRNCDREPFRMPLDQDELEVEKAADQGAVLLGYTLNKAPVIWTDRTRAMQALLCGMNGSGKTTMLENIVSQDLKRMVGPPGKRRHLLMGIFDGKGDAKFLDKMLPHIHRAGRMHQLRIIAPSRPEICARYNPFSLRTAGTWSGSIWSSARSVCAGTSLPNTNSITYRISFGFSITPGAATTSTT